MAPVPSESSGRTGDEGSKQGGIIPRHSKATSGMDGRFALLAGETWRDDDRVNCLHAACFRANHFTKREVLGMRHLQDAFIPVSTLLWAGALGSVAVASP